MNIPNALRIAGLLSLAFAVVGFYGNFVRWQDAPETSAKILNAQEQWLRRAPGNINLTLLYSVNGRMHEGKASVAPSRLEGGTVKELNIYYMKDDPDQVIPVDVLKSKQRMIGVIAGAGLVLTVLGFLIKRRPTPPPSNGGA